MIVMYTTINTPHSPRMQIQPEFTEMLGAQERLSQKSYRKNNRKKTGKKMGA